MRKKQWLGLYVAAALVVFSACAGDADTGDDVMPDTVAQPGATPPAPTGAPLPAGVTPDMVAAGQQVFNGTTCFTCHGQNGVGGDLGPNLTDQEWVNIDGEYANIQQVVRTGVLTPKGPYPAGMPAMGGAQLTDEQINQVAAYVYSISHGG